jgi:ribonuclease VapC
VFVDASAIVAILASEDDAPTLTARLLRAATIETSSLAMYEAVLGLARARRIALADAERTVADFLIRAQAEIVPITVEIGHAALQAFARYGRGRHPAQLNMGDCFAYACARARNVQLLYKGDDLAQTDLA